MIGFEGINFRIWFQRACKDSGRVSDIGPDIHRVERARELESVEAFHKYLVKDAKVGVVANDSLYSRNLYLEMVLMNCELGLAPPT